ncbi:GNAT family N-acetyltransferase [Arthrobacter sp. TMN-37]
MELDPGTVAIIQLAWSRLLKFEDSALAGDPAERIVRVDNASGRLTFVTLFGKEALVGPEWAVEAARRLPATELRQQSTLVHLTRKHGGRGLGEAQLYFSDTLPALEALRSAAVSSDREFVEGLERMCPPDDVSEAGLGGLEHRFVLVDDSRPEEPVPLAGAGYEPWAGILAHLSVLTAPQHRGRGLAARIASVAVEEAMAAGFVPQWRARVDNPASQRAARRTGFSFGGTQTTVTLG